MLACGSSDPRVERREAPAVDNVTPLLDGVARTARVANYRIDARLDVATKRITATQTLTWTNSGRDAVTSLPFHLYLNGFKNEATLFMTSSGGEHRGQRASEGAWGWIEVPSITVDGVERRPAAQFIGPDETVLELPLRTPLAPGATIEVAMQFVSQLPEVFARTGFKGDFIMVGQWFPKIGVRISAAGGERWHCEPFHVNSEFFADFGTYDVSLTVPATHLVAATGVLRRTSEAGDARTLEYRAEDVHDFAFMADPFMKVTSGTAISPLGNVQVRVYFRPGQAAFAARHLRAGIGAIEHFSKLYVPYPWPIMSIIDPPPDAAGSAGGMEYPTLVTTAGDSAFTPKGVRIGEYVTVHEVGHNWFQGMLASNEVEEAWLDEGVNDYADWIVMSELYGELNNLLDWHGWSTDTMQIRRIADIATLPAPIATRAPGFPDNSAYSTATYAKTAFALRTLENIVGTAKFRAAMKIYAQRFAFRHPTARNLQDTLESELGQSLAWFFDPAFYGLGTVDFRVRRISCRSKREAVGVFGLGEERAEIKQAKDAAATTACDVTVVNLGDIPVPVDVEIEFDDGHRQREVWDGKDHWHTFRTERDAAVSVVRVDPERKILLDTTLLKNAVRAESETSATRATGASAQFWTQSVMQLGGL